MSVEQVEFIVPASIEDRNAMKASIKELVNAKYRISGEQEYIKETVKSLVEKYDIPAKLINKMVADAYKDSFDKNVAEADMYQILFETIMLMENKTSIVSEGVVESSNPEEGIS